MSLHHALFTQEPWCYADKLTPQQLGGACEFTRIKFLTLTNQIGPKPQRAHTHTVIIAGMEINTCNLHAPHGVPFGCKTKLLLQKETWSRKPQ